MSDLVFNLQKKLALILLILVFSFMLLPVKSVLAAENFVVFPFQVEAGQSYDYLGKAIPAALQNRLNRPNLAQGKLHSQSVSSNAEAQKLANKATAIWGKVKVVDNKCTIDTYAIDAKGKKWQKTVECPVSGLMTAVSNVGQALAEEVFNLEAPVSSAVASSKTNNKNAKQEDLRPLPRKYPSGGNQQGDIIVNETGQQNVYLNPQFRYQGASENSSRLRTQRIKEKMVDMAVGDFNGDGKNEIAVLSEHNLLIYTWERAGTLQELAKIKLPTSNDTYSMRAFDVNKDRIQDLVIVTYDPEDNRPYSYFYTFKGNKLSLIAKRLPYFASVMKLPPTYEPVLVGQRWDSIKLFAPGVYQVQQTNKGYELIGRISLPDEGNVFNCAFVPPTHSNQGYVIMLTEEENIKIFQGNDNTLVHKTMDKYSGSAVGMNFYKSMPGLGVSKSTQMPSKVYAPMRLLVADIAGDGEYNLLINHPVSTASQFFDRYRYFPQGEIHSLFWDGVGMALKWKTRRIRGSVASLDLADVNNDGILDLVVGINTSPALGVGDRQSMITAYPLDLSLTDPNTQPDMSDFEKNSN